MDAYTVNLQSEIDYFSELPTLDQARLIAVFLYEITSEARATVGPGAEQAQAQDAARLRFVNELVCRLARFLEQLLADDHARPANDVVLRMLLAARPDKAAERLVMTAYRRAIHGFDRYDTTMTIDS
jgi:hypothetical protein